MYSKLNSNYNASSTYIYRILVGNTLKDHSKCFARTLSTLDVISYSNNLLPANETPWSLFTIEKGSSNINLNFLEILRATVLPNSTNYLLFKFLNFYITQSQFLEKSFY